MANMCRAVEMKQKAGQSESLWNISLSPGWSSLEMKLLKVGVMKFGLGKWTGLYNSQVLPTKNIMQCYLQLQRIMGQQSMAGFLGLHIDIDRVFIDNMKKKGLRKYGTVLINEGDKVTPERKQEMLKENQEKYGLSKEYLDYLYLPPSCNVKVYSVEKIIKARKKLSTGEKIERLIDIKQALLKKLKVLQKGKKITDFNYLRPHEFEEKIGNQMRAYKHSHDLTNEQVEEKSTVQTIKPKSRSVQKKPPAQDFLPKKQDDITQKKVPSEAKKPKEEVPKSQDLSKKKTRLVPTSKSVEKQQKEKPILNPKEAKSLLTIAKDILDLERNQSNKKVCSIFSNTSKTTFLKRQKLNHIPDDGLEGSIIESQDCQIESKV